MSIKAPQSRLSCELDVLDQSLAGAPVLIITIVKFHTITLARATVSSAVSSGLKIIEPVCMSQEGFKLLTWMLSEI